MVSPVVRRASGLLSQAYWLRQRLAAHTAGQAGVLRGRSAFYQRVWEEAAREAGAPCRMLPGGVLEIGGGDATLRVRENVTSLDDPVTLHVAADKRLVYSLLADAGVPIPRHAVLPDGDPATGGRFLKDAGVPCTVKPAWGTAGGAGVTTGVTGPGRLFAALSFARAGCPDVLIEESLRGDDYRLLYLDGEMLDAVLRRPATVRGDGRSTIGELVAVENSARREGGLAVAQSLVHVDQELRQTLAGQRLSLRTVLECGRLARLKNAVSENRAAENEDAAGRLCPEVVEAGARAAAAVGARFVGVDLITSDASVPLAATGGAVIEVNTTPSLYYHYMKAGGPTPVARMVLERCLNGTGRAR